MRTVVVTVDNTGNSPAVVLDQYLTPFNVTYIASAGTVQSTNDDPFPYSPTGTYIAPTLNWATISTDAPNAAGFIGKPTRAIRLHGTQGDTLTVIQAGIK